MCKHCFQRVRHLFFIFCQQQSHIGSPYFGKQVTIRSVYFVRITGTNPVIFQAEKRGHIDCRQKQQQ